MASKQPVEEMLQYNMIHAHNTFKFGYDIIVSHLDNPPLDDLKNFIGYCQAWVDSIEGHHDAEEEVVFPFLNRKLDFSQEQEQHKLIHSSLQTLTEKLTAAKADPSKFDAAELKAIVTGFKDPLYQHLDEEVAHLAPENMKDFDQKELLDLNLALDKHAKSHGDPFLLVPFMRSHTPPELKDSWPPMPWMLRKVVIPYMLAKRYSGYWKYAPYAMS
ncbi:hypothetical protein PUNSTDRAFT_102186 [Punctularia strigosozonata HHB-11173 SS5]|uniref:uncharacterized protein n=1 Tax=Punctularia strigosozonata (strain HHB-11173) TaxID=741275 RepID=UPI0004417BBF|nr:uncharacterized protein PUNSTDRAFT_102186 [Punctularia strigosozonata HHB-11173 SS5]EIN08723.1 hypothetical protein PUNSTDRAFT_102186 [Punctularia strigosozonata HHB-11173 SS5]